jgi:serine/threonine protein kinase
MPVVKSFKVRKGTEINDYTIVKSLGRGWEGEVYQVVENYSGGNRVMKLFDPVGYRSKQIGEYASKFEKLSGVSGIIRYYHAGYWEKHDVYYLIMEYFSGTDLEVLSQKPWPVFKALKAVRNIYRIIGECHMRGECVGDLHAGNVLVDPEGCMKIIDIDCGISPSKEHIIQDIVAATKLLYEIIGSSSELPADLRRILPKKEDAIRKRYGSSEQVLTALDELMGN